MESSKTSKEDMKFNENNKILEKPSVLTLVLRSAKKDFLPNSKVQKNPPKLHSIEHLQYAASHAIRQTVDGTRWETPCEPHRKKQTSPMEWKEGKTKHP